MMPGDILRRYDCRRRCEALAADWGNYSLGAAIDGMIIQVIRQLPLETVARKYGLELDTVRELARPQTGGMSPLEPPTGRIAGKAKTRAA